MRTWGRELPVARLVIAAVAAFVCLALLLILLGEGGRQIVLAIVLALVGFGVGAGVVQDFAMAEDETKTRSIVGLTPTFALAGVDLRDAVLTGAHLANCDLAGARLQGANLRGANLSKAELSRADLRGADLRGADITCARFEDAIYDDWTRWPDAAPPKGARDAKREPLRRL